MNTLPAATRLGPAALTVSDLERSLDFYQRVLGMQVQRRAGQTAVLGAGDAALLVLVEDRQAKPKPVGRGLFHVAIVVPSRAELALALYHLARTQTPLQGLSDHFVSEAIYLADPDGIGLEIYRDLPRADWRYFDGRLNIGTAALDVDGVMAELMEEPPQDYAMPPGTRVGHMHLHVDDVAAAERFYHDVIGFDLIVRFGSVASFLAAGGYHHHLGVRNGYGKAPQDALGLRWYTLMLPDDAALSALRERLAHAGYEIRQDAEGLFFHDSAGHRVQMNVEGQVS